MIGPRRGISILELLVIMSASTVVLTLSSLLIIRAMRVQMESRAHCDIERNALRLSKQLRSDVHQSHTAETNDEAEKDGVFLRLQWPDGKRVDYSRVGGIVLRLASTNGNQVWREEFAFPAACDLDIRELDTPPRIALTITASAKVAPSADQPPASTLAVPVSFHVEATLGRDRRPAETDSAGENP
jgi:hypothetical protein